MINGLKNMGLCLIYTPEKQKVIDCQFQFLELSDQQVKFLLNKAPNTFILERPLRVPIFVLSLIISLFTPDEPVNLFMYICTMAHLVHLPIRPIADNLDQLKDSCWILWKNNTLGLEKHHNTNRLLKCLTVRIMPTEFALLVSPARENIQLKQINLEQTMLI